MTRTTLHATAGALVCGSFFFATPAFAKCEAQVKKVETSTGDALVSAFSSVIACDKKIANDIFPRAMRRATESDTLVALSMVAIEAEVWNPVWEMLGEIPDYEAQDIVAEGIGQSCAENEMVVRFLQGAYFGLRDIEFGRWDDALVACDAPTFDAWLVQTVESPPAKQFDEKWDTVAQVYVQRKGVDALPALAKGAVHAAGNSGPYESILAHMEAAVAPGLGEAPNPAHQKALEDALVSMATELPPDKARSVADRLANSGSDAAAAKLLPSIYPERVSASGGFDYGAVAVELADCDGTKSAVLHAATVKESGKRYQFLSEVEAPMRALKPRLSKCSAEGGDWVVLISPEPLNNKSDFDTFVAGLETRYSGQGYEVKVRDEKDIVLP